MNPCHSQRLGFHGLVPVLVLAPTFGQARTFRLENVLGTDSEKLVCMGTEEIVGSSFQTVLVMSSVGTVYVLRKERQLLSNYYY